ncbi:MAG: glycosyltransferase family 2 protein [Candidatus Hodarchaeota archaeon]
MEPRLSAVVCTYNRSHYLKAVLQSLADQYLDKSQYEVIIVDNNSIDQTEQVARSFLNRYSNFRYVREPKQGLSYARNRGYKEARGEYIAYIDDDAKANPDWGERILNAFETITPKPVAVGGNQQAWWERPPPKWLADFMGWIRGSKKGFLQPPYAQYGFGGYNMAIKKSILEQFSGFLPKYGRGGNIALGEESELFHRIYQDHPYFWYDPSIEVKHRMTISKMRLPFRIKQAFLSGIVSKQMHGASKYLVIVALMAIPFFIFILPLRVWWWRKNWQKAIFKSAVDISWAIGFLKSTVNQKFRSTSYKPKKQPKVKINLKLLIIQFRLKTRAYLFHHF